MHPARRRYAVFAAVRRLASEREFASQATWGRADVVGGASVDSDGEVPFGLLQDLRARTPPGLTAARSEDAGAQRRCVRRRAARATFRRRIVLPCASTGDLGARGVRRGTALRAGHLRRPWWARRDGLPPSRGRERRLGSPGGASGSGRGGGAAGLRTPCQGGHRRVPTLGAHPRRLSRDGRAGRHSASRRRPTHLGRWLGRVRGRRRLPGLRLRWCVGAPGRADRSGGHPGRGGLAGLAGHQRHVAEHRRPRDLAGSASRGAGAGCGRPTRRGRPAFPLLGGAGTAACRRRRR